MKKRDLSRSEDYWARAAGLIPAGTQTLSKGPSQYVDGVAPKYIARGAGSHVWDVDGNEYIDYPMGLGSVILGHAYPAVVAAVRAQLESGSSFSLMHPLEVEVSELLRQIIPCAEMVRFGKNGSDVTTAAIRVARAHTGRERVAHCGYHGWMDWYIGSTTRNKGVPRSTIELQHAFAYNDLASLRAVLEAHPGEFAAVIMEPYGATMPAPGFLEGVRDLTHQHGAVLIFDEIASGFRFEIGGIYRRFGIEPDVACFGKAMANGIPLAALVGRAKVMQVLEEVFFSFTFGGETLGLAAAKATIEEMCTRPVLKHINEVGTILMDGLNRLSASAGFSDSIQCVGLGPRSFVTFAPLAGEPPLVVKSLFQQEVIKRGILSISAGHCPSFSHSRADIDRTLAVYEEAFAVLREAADKGDITARLEGRPVLPVFRPVN